MVEVRLAMIDPKEWAKHERNTKTHPATQKQLFQYFLEEVGFVTAVVVNEKTKKILDGHLRIEKAIQNNIEKIPAVILNCDEEDELKILLYLDKITKMSGSYRAKELQILKDITFRNELLEKDREYLVKLFQEETGMEVLKTPPKQAYCVLVFFSNDRVFEMAKEIFDLKPGIHPQTKRITKNYVVDGDKWIQKF